MSRERLAQVEEKYAAVDREIARLTHTGAAPSAALTALLTERGTADAPDGCPLVALLRGPSSTMPIWPPSNRGGRTCRRT